MKNLFVMLEKKIDSTIFAFIGNGVVLLLLGLLIAFSDFMLRVVVGAMVFVVSYAFFFWAYRLWTIKKEIEKWIGRA